MLSAPVFYLFEVAANRATALVADHPGARSGKTLGAAPGLGHQPRRLLPVGRALVLHGLARRPAAAARAMRGLVLRERLRRVRAALVDSVSFSLLRRHAQEI